MKRPGSRREQWARWLTWWALAARALPFLAVLIPARTGGFGPEILEGAARSEARCLLTFARLATARLQRRPSIDEVQLEAAERFVDPWGSEWVMEPGDRGAVFTFRSAGPDRCFRTADDVVGTNAHDTLPR